ncbi:hypothetical protein [Longivirga aurantiaca]|uniref:Uncharacterized protein n=1 Tax=Longivirga aurantiaca TaxID=1837743 RepID=A0ABW1T0S0_9ACTN
MRRYASGMTGPVHVPFEETALLWEMAGETAFSDPEVVPGYSGSGHDWIDLAEIDLRREAPDVPRRITPDVLGLEAGHFLG